MRYGSRKNARRAVPQFLDTALPCFQQLLSECGLEPIMSPGIIVPAHQQHHKYGAIDGIYPLGQTTFSVAQPLLLTYNCNQLPEESNDSTSTRLVTEEEYYPVVEVDEKNLFDNLLWQRLKGKNLAQWIEIFHNRNAQRSRYGTNPARHTHISTSSTIKANTEGGNTRKTLNEKKRLADERHRRDEKHRRDRHRHLQHRIDCLTSEIAFDLAPEAVPLLKTQLQQDSSSNTRRAENMTTGKDEQLVACLFYMKLSRWIVGAYQQKERNALCVAIAEPEPHAQLISEPCVVNEETIPPVSPCEQKPGLPIRARL